MPYHANTELPVAVKEHLPAHAQDIFRKAFNSAYEEYDEATAFKVAWAAVKKEYEKQGDKWVKKG